MVVHQKIKSCFFGMLLTAAVVAVPRPGDFRPIGPGGGGTTYYPTISPHDTNTVLVASDMTGGYITRNGGKSWRMFNLRQEIGGFTFDPLDPKVLYALAGALWRSADEGETWQLVYPKPSSVKGVEMNSDHADERILADPEPWDAIKALAVDPGDSKTLYVAAETKGGAALFVSHDWGEGWRQDFKLSETPHQIWVDPTSAPSSRRLFLSGRHTFSIKSGRVVRSIATPTEFTDSAGGFERSGKVTFYGVSKAGLFVSTDGAETWKKSELPGRGGSLGAVATSLHYPETAYVSYAGLSLYFRKWFGVAKTTNFGRSWELVWKEEQKAAPNVHDGWITARFGPSWAGNPVMLGVADQDPRLAYATDNGRTMRTNDGGESWNAVYSHQRAVGTWTSTGLDVTTSYGIHFDPFNSNRQFITYSDIGLFRSEDGGRSWSSSTQGVPGRWVNTTYWIEFDPVVPGRMWSVNSGTHDLPRPKMWTGPSGLKDSGGVCRSDDGGKTWVQSNLGMEESASTHILLDTSSSSSSRVLYVAAFGRGVYKSLDGGRSWNLKNRGILEKQPFAWRLARAPDGELYLILVRRSRDGRAAADGEEGALYRSRDGAEHWVRMDLPPGVNAPNGIAIDPRSPATLYLAAWARPVGNHGQDGGVYISNDSGRTWRHTLQHDQHVYDVTIDPRDPNIVYAAGFESSAWRSTDSGATWTRVPGYNFKWGHRVIPDPEHNDMVYITTFGGSVWHGSVKGKPGPVDITTPKLDPGQTAVSFTKRRSKAGL